jgi:acetylornithine deacetylase
VKALGTVEILERLVSYPTVSANSNVPLIDWVRNYLADCGVSSQLVPDASGLKANLFATIGPAAPDGLVFSGHTDVVPVDEQTWASDPFRVTVRGSRLHGRGACDMKGFIAAVLARVPAWTKASLRRPAHLMFSYDEEIGCLGVSSMITAARNSLPQPAAVIVGEPTDMRLATQHKGTCFLRTRVAGIEAHSSLTHRGHSAIMLAAELIAELERISERLALIRVPSGRAFEPPYTTLSVNRISGGTANNILAALCEFIWDIRPLPGERSLTVVQEIASYAERRLAELLSQGKAFEIETILLTDVPPLQAEEGGLAAELVRSVAAHLQEEIAVPFGSEAGYFQQEGWSTVVCGPGSIEQAHKPDEFIERSQLTECEGFLDRLVDRQLIQG